SANINNLSVIGGIQSAVRIDEAHGRPIIKPRSSDVAGGASQGDEVPRYLARQDTRPRQCRSPLRRIRGTRQFELGRSPGANGPSAPSRLAGGSLYKGAFRESNVDEIQGHDLQGREWHGTSRTWNQVLNFPAAVFDRIDRYLIDQPLLF